MSGTKRTIGLLCCGAMVVWLAVCAAGHVYSWVTDESPLPEGVSIYFVVMAPILPCMLLLLLYLTKNPTTDSERRQRLLDLKAAIPRPVRYVSSLVLYYFFINLGLMWWLAGGHASDQFQFRMWSSIGMVCAAMIAARSYGALRLESDGGN